MALLAKLPRPVLLHRFPSPRRSLWPHGYAARSSKALCSATVTMPCSAQGMMLALKIEARQDGSTHDEAANPHVVAERSSVNPEKLGTIFFPLSARAASHLFSVSISSLATFGASYAGAAVRISVLDIGSKGYGSGTSPRSKPKRVSTLKSEQPTIDLSTHGSPPTALPTRLAPASATLSTDQSLDSVPLPEVRVTTTAAVDCRSHKNTKRFVFRALPNGAKGKIQTQALWDILRCPEVGTLCSPITAKSYSLSMPLAYVPS